MPGGQVQALSTQRAEVSTDQPVQEPVLKQRRPVKRFHRLRIRREPRPIGPQRTHRNGGKAPRPGARARGVSPWVPAGRVATAPGSARWSGRTAPPPPLAGPLPRRGSGHAQQLPGEQRHPAPPCQCQTRFSRRGHRLMFQQALHVPLRELDAIPAVPRRPLRKSSSPPHTPASRRRTDHQRHRHQ